MTRYGAPVAPVVPVGVAGGGVWVGDVAGAVAGWASAGAGAGVGDPSAEVAPPAAVSPAGAAGAVAVAGVFSPGTTSSTLCARC